MFPKIVVSQNGWFIMENPIKFMTWGGKKKTLLLETPNVLPVCCDEKNPKLQTGDEEHLWT